MKKLDFNFPLFYISGIECGWNQGEPCNACQELLFHSIQDGHFDFPHTEWRDISGEAKDLISKLLVKDARQRLSAEMVLSHPWVKYGGPSKVLVTPQNIKRYVLFIYTDWGDLVVQDHWTQIDTVFS